MKQLPTIIDKLISLLEDSWFCHELIFVKNLLRVLEVNKDGPLTSWKDFRAQVQDAAVDFDPSKFIEDYAVSQLTQMPKVMFQVIWEWYRAGQKEVHQDQILEKSTRQDEIWGNLIPTIVANGPCLLQCKPEITVITQGQSEIFSAAMFGIYQAHLIHPSGEVEYGSPALIMHLLPQKLKEYQPLTVEQKKEMNSFSPQEIKAQIPQILTKLQQYIFPTVTCDLNRLTYIPCAQGVHRWFETEEIELTPSEFDHAVDAVKNMVWHCATKGY